MKEFTIPIECPEGYLPVAYRVPSKGDSFVNFYNLIEICMDDNYEYFRLIVEKIEPRKKTFVCISEEPRVAVKGEYYENGGMLNAMPTGSSCEKYKIWKEVKE
tara:strand:+ start:2052 stop:2360 length:309 start_codon:yes stop_codon:yes gene_type:complete